MILDTTFDSHGSELAAHLYLPSTGEGPFPAVILCHGFCGVKELLLPGFAQAFADAGFAALTFDYRGFGASGGEPGRLVPRLQIEDIGAALDHMAARDDIDSARLALWGTSFGGANAIVAASQDDRVRCLCVQLTFGDGERVITGDMSADEKDKFLGMVAKMQDKKTRTGKEMMVPIGKVLTDAQSRQFYQEYKADYPALDIRIPFLTVAETLSHKPEQVIDQVKAPILIVAAEHDGVNPPAESSRLYGLAKQPKKLHTVPGATHYAVYEGELLAETAAVQLDWLREHLA